MIKYNKEEYEKADRIIRTYLSQGFTYHQAAKKVAEYSPISVISLRYRAYYIALKEGYFAGSNLQHRADTIHGDLLSKCKKRLENEGYNVIAEQNQIRKFVESRGSKGNPDLIATRNNEIVLIEVIERVKAVGTFIDQLERYTKIGKLIIVFPLDTTNLQIWGKQKFT
jgi:hypothetical protein